MPSREDFEKRSPDSISWVGRASAALTRWDHVRSIVIDSAVDDINRALDNLRNINDRAKLTSLLHQARADLRLDVGSLSVLIDKGRAFDYFDELRKVIEPARSDVFFVDPYLDAEFVTRYLPHVTKGTTV